MPRRAWTKILLVPLKPLISLGSMTLSEWRSRHLRSRVVPMRPRNGSWYVETRQQHRSPAQFQRRRHRQLPILSSQTTPSSEFLKTSTLAPGLPPLHQSVLLQTRPKRPRIKMAPSLSRQPFREFPILSVSVKRYLIIVNFVVMEDSAESRRYSIAL